MRLVERSRAVEERAAVDHATGMFGTSYSLCALAHFDCPASLGYEGVGMGPIRSGGGWLYYDPFVVYGRRRRYNVTGPNMAVMGEIGGGKSTTIQVYLRRQWPYDRFIRVIDPRGEYRALARDLNGQIVRLARDGGITLNPLEAPETRHDLLKGMAAAAARRELNEREPALLNVALDAAGAKPVLPAVLDRLFYPTADMASQVGTTARRFAAEARDVAMALQPLCEGDLRGMFDGPTTADVDFHNQFILLDLSAMWGSQSLGILMACATSFLQAQIDDHYRTGDLVGQPPKSILVVDEAWKVLALPGVGEWLRERLKFSRKLAQQNIVIFHGPRDPDATGADGDHITKIAKGLIRDCDTFVLCKASEDDAADIQKIIGLSDVERGILVDKLEVGDALWRIGPFPFVVSTHATSDDLRVTSPDRAMTG